jgi:cell division protease FtsH
LLEKEIIFQADLERLFGKRPYESPTTYQKFTNGQTAAAKTEEKKEELPKETIETDPSEKKDI